MKFRKETITAQQAVKKAGKVLMEFFNQGKKLVIHSKGAEDFTTEADLAAEKVVVGLIRKHFPSHNILSEEMGRIDNGSDYTWILDPLDGTHNFSYGVPLWGVMLALEYKGDVVISSINLPTLGELCVAQRNSGTYLNGKKTHVSGRHEIKKAMVYFSEAERSKFFSRVANPFYRELRILGCIAAGGVLVASGRMDGIVAPWNNPWDMKPVALLVEEAGGKATDFNGSKYSDRSKGFVFSNGLIHNDILRILKR